MMRWLSFALLFCGTSWGASAEAQAPDTLRLPHFYREPMERHAQRISEADSLRILLAGRATIVRRARLVAGGIAFTDATGASLPDSLGPGMRLRLSVRARATGRGALIGGIVGTGLGIVLGVEVSEFCLLEPGNESCESTAIGVTTLFFGGLGLGIGALIGALSDTWKTIYDTERPDF